MDRRCGRIAPLLLCSWLAGVSVPAAAAVIPVATALRLQAVVYPNQLNPVPTVGAGSATSPGAANLQAEASVQGLPPLDGVTVETSASVTFADTAHGAVTLTEGWNMDSPGSAGTCFGCFDENSGFFYRFVTDEAGELRIDWSWARSGANQTGFLRPYILLDGSVVFVPTSPSGFMTRQLQANTEYEIGFVSTSNRNGGNTNGESGLVATFQFAIPGVGLPIPEPGTASLVALGIAGIALMRRARHRGLPENIP
jgi:hypothetical protein